MLKFTIKNLHGKGNGKGNERGNVTVYYNLSTYRPDAIDVAIPRKAKVSTLPDWPELNVCYFTDDRFDVGIETIEEGKNKFRIYDIEKTVVPFLSCQAS